MKSHVLFTFGAGVLLSANAFGTLVAGWDFSQFAFSGANSINGADFAGAGVAEPNYSDLQLPSPGVAAEAFGAIYYDGSFGSTDVAPASFTASTAPASGNLASAEIQTADGNPFNDLGSYNLLKDSGQALVNDLSLGLTVDSDLVFSADLSSEGEVGSSWELRFAAKGLAEGDASTITWEVSTDGSTYTAVAGDPTVTSSLDTEYVIAGGPTLDGAGTVYFRATVSGIGTQLLIDNAGLHTTIGATATTWGGYAIVTNPDGSRWADTSADWLGYLNIDSAPFLYSFELDVWLFLSEPAEDANGAWAYMFKNGANTPVSGWGGYPVTTNSDGSRWADTSANWIGDVNIDTVPYLFNWQSQCWMFANEPADDANGSWFYVFKR